MTQAPVVGNDVVYLADPDIAGHHRRERFVARVCAAAEVERVRAAGHPRQVLWSLFAAKEAAYKAVIKLRPRVAFAPRLFEVDAAWTQVRYRDLTLCLTLSRDPARPEPAWVHAVVCSRSVTTMAGIETMAAGAHQSAAVRELACRDLAAHLDVPRHRLSIERDDEPAARDGLAPPCLRLDGRPLAVDISLSHDGPYVAYAAVDRPAPLASS